MMEKLIFDSNVYDLLVVEDENEGVISKIEYLIKCEQLQLLITHIQFEQIANITGKDAKRLRLLMAVAKLPHDQLPTAGVVFGVSRLGQAAFSSPDESRIINDAVSESGNHGPDALLISTAFHHGAVFVTEDIDAYKRAIRNNVRAWKFIELLEFIEEVSNRAN